MSASLSQAPQEAWSIAAVERDTGLSKDTLRVWERRYGFPQPGRDALGERLYSADEVRKLRLLKRLLDGGHRPGRVVPLPLAALEQLFDGGMAARASAEAAPAAGVAVVIERLFELLGTRDVEGVRRELAQALGRLGVGRFVTELLPPLNTRVGELWMQGRLEVADEHLLTEAQQGLLHSALHALPAPETGSRPRVLLSTPPGEPHGLGLLMAEALLRVEGCACVPLGVQTPVWDLARAAQAYRCDVVALGFSGCVPPRQVAATLEELCAQLPAGVELWVGGQLPPLERRPLAAKLRVVRQLDLLPEAVRQWRVQRD